MTTSGAGPEDPSAQGQEDTFAPDPADRSAPDPDPADPSTPDPSDPSIPDPAGDAGRATGIESHHLQVSRTARITTLGPSDDSAVRDVWVVLHGYRQLAGRFLRRFQDVDDGTRRIVAPEGLSRFYVEREVGRHGPESLVGASWMTREEREHEIRDYVAYLDRVAELFLPPTRSGHRIPRTVLGFSQGVATAARWITMGAHACHRLVCWGDTLPPDLDPEAARTRLEGVELIFVRGVEDGTRRPEVEAEQEDWLRRREIPFRVITHPGGHRIDRGVLAELAKGGVAA